jgi:hypothetical protein
VVIVINVIRIDINLNVVQLINVEVVINVAHLKIAIRVILVLLTILVLLAIPVLHAILGFQVLAIQIVVIPMKYHMDLMFLSIYIGMGNVGKWEVILFVLERTQVPLDRVLMRLH